MFFFIEWVMIKKAYQLLGLYEPLSLQPTNIFNKLSSFLETNQSTSLNVGFLLWLSIRKRKKGKTEDARGFNETEDFGNTFYQCPKILFAYLMSINHTKVSWFLKKYDGTRNSVE